MPFSFANYPPEKKCNRARNFTLSTVETPPTATAGEIDVPSTHTNIIAVSTATSAPAFAASVAV